MNRKLWLVGLVAGLMSVGACRCGPGDEDGAGADGGSGTPGADGGQGQDGGSSDGGGDAGAPIIVDPLDPQNPTLDSDCDGLTDAEEFASVYAGGKRTSPALADSDGDGVLDGVELSRTSSVNAACGFTGDADTATRTSPTEADSDSDGMADGREDVNGNGKLDPGELDPNDPDSDGDGLRDGVEDKNASGAVDPGETDPRNRDSDADSIPDGTEVNVTLTDPTKVDTDGDTCRDGDEDLNQNGVKDGVAETNPKDGSDCGAANVPDADNDGLPDALEDKNQNGAKDSNETDWQVADTDGDGLKDGLEDRNKNGYYEGGETNPLKRDTDCDGLADGTDLAGGVRGEDRNASGAVDLGETDPTRRDTDGDGLDDGVELGVTLAGAADAAGCPGTRYDGEPGTTTNPASADSDGDGISDGAEDANQNGKVDPGELNPNSSADGQGPAGKVCTADSLRPVLFRSELQADLQLGLPSTFTEVQTTAGTTGRGLIGYDPTHKVAFLAYRRIAPGANVTEDETNIRGGLNAVGTITAPITQPFTTWDGMSALQGFYDQAGNSDLKGRINALATQLLGAGATGLAGSAGVNGPFKMRAQLVHRTAQALVVVIALMPTSLYQEPGIFSIIDTAGGTALAQFGDPNAVQCETFTAKGAKVDFLFVVDDSGSMAGSQTALAQAATAMANSLNNSSIDYRIAMVTTEYHLGSSGNQGVRRGFTRNIEQFKAWLTEDSVCSSGFCTLVAPGTPCDSNGAAADGRNGGCWIDVSGSGSEGSLGAAREAVEDLTPTSSGEVNDKFRADAQVVVVLLGDADDQTVNATSTNAACYVTTPWPARTPNTAVTVGTLRVNDGTRVYRVDIAGTTGSGGGPTGTGNNQTDGTARWDYAGTLQQCEDINRFINYFKNTGSVAGVDRNSVNQAIPVHGIVCSNGGNCNGETQIDPRRNLAVLTATSGVFGQIDDANSIASNIQTIVDSSIGASGYRLTKPPIGASVKLAMDGVLDGAACSKDDIPRSRVNGFDIDGLTGRLSLFGACRAPNQTGVAAAVSYRYWIDSTPDPAGNPPPCVNDPDYDAADPDFCKGRLACNRTTNVCECPVDCGGTPPPGKVCNTSRQVCDFVCTPDCAGSCTGYQTCEQNACVCQCVQNATCAPGFVFQNGGGVCGCVCDTAALGCGSTYQVDESSCSCVCKADCGGCETGTCNTSTCSCGSPIG